MGCGINWSVLPKSSSKEVIPIHETGVDIAGVPRVGAPLHTPRIQFLTLCFETPVVALAFPTQRTLAGVYRTPS